MLPHLKTLEAMRARKAAQVHLLDYLGLGLALDAGAESRHRKSACSRISVAPYTLGRYSDCLDVYAAEVARASRMRRVSRRSSSGWGAAP